MSFSSFLALLLLVALLPTAVGIKTMFVVCCRVHFAFVAVAFARCSLPPSPFYFDYE